MSALDFAAEQQRRFAEASAAVLGDPRFPQTLPHFCRVIAEVWAHLRRVGLPVDDAGSFSAAVVVIVTEGALSATEVEEFCAVMKLASRHRARALLDALQAKGFIERGKDPGDARRVMLRATPLLIGHFQRWIAALADVTAPWSGVAAADVDEPMVRQYLGVIAEAYRAGFVLYQGFPVVEAFMHRRSGYSLLLSLLGRAGPDGAATLNRAQFATAHGVSRPHVVVLLREAEARGWLTRGRADAVTLAPPVIDETRRWIASEIAWATYAFAAVRTAAPATRRARRAPSA